METSKVLVALLVIVSCTALIVTGARGQRSSTPAPRADRPHPFDIVNLSGDMVLRPGESHIIYEVPVDAWLVVTDADKVSKTVDVGELGTLDGGEFRALLNATDFFDGYHSSVGLAFPAGSQVVVANRHPRTTARPWWDVTGYLVR